MNYYHVSVDLGKRKRFSWGDHKELINFKRIVCTICGYGQLITADPNQKDPKDPDLKFDDKAWNMEIYMHRNHFADFALLGIRTIVSEKARTVLLENFNNAVDFGDLKMISLRDFTEQEKKELRGRIGSAWVNRIANDPPQYFRLLLKQGMDLDFKKSKVKLVLDCPECGCKFYKEPRIKLIRKEISFPTRYLIESTWKGYDIFYAEGRGFTMFCTERFIEAYEQAELTGLLFDQIHHLSDTETKDREGNILTDGNPISSSTFLI